MQENPIWVNSRGERFTDEAIGAHPFEAGNAILMQPGKVMYTLLDTSIKDEMMELMQPDKITNSLPDTAIKDKLERKVIALDKALPAEAARGKVKIADSWNGIAEWIGADLTTLKATVDEYNVYCDHGYDALFAKDRRYLLPLRRAPYYAIRCEAHFLDTMGGIRINEHMEVLNSQDRPIHGLYAAGVVASGWEAETYCSDLNGSAFGFAINSGRIAAENAAAFILETK